MADPTFLLASALSSLPLLEEVESGTLDDLAQRLRLCIALGTELQALRRSLELTIDERMEAPQVETRFGILKRVPKPDGESWDRDGARTAARRAIAGVVALDPETQEVRPDWATIASRTFDLVHETIGTDKPKGGGPRARTPGAFFRKLGLDPGDYVTRTPAGNKIEMDEAI